MKQSSRWAVRRTGVWALLLLSATLVISGATIASTGTGTVLAATDPVIAAAGDISCDPLNGGFNGGAGTATDCRAKYTAALLPGVDKVLTLGDLQYACGGLSAFNQAYDPTWGLQRAITEPVPGNHEYQTSGGTGCSTNASGYYTYFGGAAGDPAKGYYSFDLGAWHIIALNSECANIGGCGAGSAQETWLRNDLAANSQASCTLAYWHRPRFSSGGADTTFSAFWQDLYNARADVVLTGHMHWYERFALQNPSGQADPNGIRQFIVGTGGESYVAPSSTRAANSQALNWGQSAFGILKMTLHPGGYDWMFVPDTGTYADTGSQPCHKAPTGTPTPTPTSTPPPAPDTTAPSTSALCNGSTCSTGWYRSSPVSMTMVAKDDGSGVAATYYTVDGSTPNANSPRYLGDPIAVSQTTTVKYYSVDVAGNAEAVRAQPVSIDAAAPAVTMTSPTSGATYRRGSAVPLAATASDAGTGSGSPSGVAKVSFYRDGVLLATSVNAPYAYTWKPNRSVRGAHTLTAVAVDAAGNSTTSAPVSITFN